jgi:putative intracellular protease/amidase
MKVKRRHVLVLICLLLTVIIYLGCAPVREFYRFPKYKGNNQFNYAFPFYDQTKKTIILVADNEGTEIFDLMAPFCLFSLTHKLNVYVVAENKYPIVVMKGAFILPHFTFRQIDSLKMLPSVIVVPNLSAMNKKEVSPFIVQWIKKKYSDSTSILSICAGSLTTAATGLYDNKQLTTHASEFSSHKKQFGNPQWVKNVSFTKSENLYSTAGVSNAVEGSLTMIKEMFGEQVMRDVMDSIHYPYRDIKIQHNSIALTMRSNLIIGAKVYLKKNRTIGVLLQNGVDEFSLAAVLDTYHRSFPSSIKTFLISGESVVSKHGLTIIPTADIHEIKKFDELHVLRPELLSKSQEILFGSTALVKYGPLNKEYIFNQCLEKIMSQYGDKFEKVVKLLLDYN